MDRARLHVGLRVRRACRVDGMAALVEWLRCWVVGADCADSRFLDSEARTQVLPMHAARLLRDLTLFAIQAGGQTLETWWKIQVI